MEFDFLYSLQNMHCEWLDKLMVMVFNDIVGSKGQLWAILGIILLVIPKTRKAGISVILSYAFAFLIGDVILKDLIARPRPCAIDETVTLLISRPTSFSCPSVHSMLAFASATAVFWFHKKSGIAALIFAALVGFSRMYFFVHFPTDVLFGAVLGFAIGTAVNCIVKRIHIKKRDKNSKASKLQMYSETPKKA